MLSLKFYNPGPDGKFIREGPEVYPKTIITVHVSLWRFRFRGQQGRNISFLFPCGPKSQR